MKISFAITVCNEIEEIKRLVPFLFEHKRKEDEIVILYDEKNGNPEILDFLLPYNKFPHVQTWRGFDFKGNFADWKNKLNDYCAGDYIYQIDADEMISEYMVQNLSTILEMNPNVDSTKQQRPTMPHYYYLVITIFYMIKFCCTNITRRVCTWGSNISSKLF